MARGNDEDIRGTAGVAWHSFRPAAIALDRNHEGMPAALPRVLCVRRGAPGRGTATSPTFRFPRGRTGASGGGAGGWGSAGALSRAGADYSGDGGARHPYAGGDQRLPPPSAGVGAVRAAEY